MYDFNLLISYPWRQFRMAREEAKRTLAKLGDKMPIILKTWARGIGGVKTKLNSRKVIAKIRELYRANPLEFNFVQKWVQLIIGVTLNSNR